MHMLKACQRSGTILGATVAVIACYIFFAHPVALCSKQLEQNANAEAS